MPAALEGEQYELWDADNAPLPSELIASQPKYIPVNCRLCGTLMHATEPQIGNKLTCPDCGSQTVVSPPAGFRTPRNVLVPDDEAYQLDENRPPPERPPVVPIATGGLLYEQEREAELAREESLKARGKAPRTKTDVRGRPILPRFPLITGILSFLLSPGVPIRWVTLSALGIIWCAMGLFGFGEVGAAGGTLGQMAAIGGVCSIAFTCIVGCLWMMALASSFVAIVIESSEGNDRVHHWPPMSTGDWFIDLLRVLLAAFVSAFPGWLAAQFLAPTSAAQLLMIAAGAVISFPIILLSQLELDSPFAVLSAQVLRSWVKCPVSWIVLYMESALLVAAGVWAAQYAGGIFTSLLTILPLSVLAAIVYARLLGRLAWVLAEELSTADTAVDRQGKLGNPSARYVK
jgi:hypothetical protein